MKTGKLLILFTASFAMTTAWSSEREELLKLKNTTLNLIQALVEEGLLPAEKARKLIRRAEAKAAEEAKEAAAEAEEEASSKKAIRVTYVPQFVREEIEEKVREELRKDVVDDVKVQAREEGWGIPGSLPEWLERISLTADLRLRGEEDFYASGNQANTILDFNEVNNAGGIIPAGQDAFLDTTQNRKRLRLRARVGLNAQVTDNLKVGFRVTTGNIRNPVSLNQTLGNTGRRYEIALDRAFFQYDAKDPAGFPWLTLMAGRTPNPWLHTDLVWDDDLSFEGVMATGRLAFGESTADHHRPHAFLTGGFFPLQEEKFSADDKWMVGGQLGVDWPFQKASRVRFGVAYYDYHNIAGVPNKLGSTEQDFTAPQFVQNGNTMFDIRTDADLQTNLFALASDFNIINFTAKYDYTGFDPVHLTLTGDYARNIGFDQGEIFRRTGLSLNKNVDAWQVRLDVGWPKVEKFGDWKVFFAYKRLEANSVVDAFSDSNFHLGGTNAQGYVVGGAYGLAKNTWLRVRWYSTDQIEGPQYGVDTLQLDLNSKL